MQTINSNQAKQAEDFYAGIRQTAPDGIEMDDSEPEPINSNQAGERARNVFGIPGIGGSLGQCAYCGADFMMEILTGAKVSRFSIGTNLLAAHNECFRLYSQCEDWRNLPIGPLRKATEKAESSAT